MSTLKPSDRGYIPPECVVPVSVGVYVHGFAGWHKVAKVAPEVLTVCGMGFIPQPTQAHSGTGLGSVCFMCADGKGWRS